MLADAPFRRSELTMYCPPSPARYDAAGLARRKENKGDRKANRRFYLFPISRTSPSSPQDLSPVSTEHEAGPKKWRQSLVGRQRRYRSIRIEQALPAVLAEHPKLCFAEGIELAQPFRPKVVVKANHQISRGRSGHFQSSQPARHLSAKNDAYRWCKVTGRRLPRKWSRQFEQTRGHSTFRQ